MAESEKELVQRGYQREFLDSQIPNHPIKREFLHCYHAHHDIALYRHPSQPTLELIKHSDEFAPGQGAFQYGPQGVTMSLSSLSHLSFYVECLGFKLESENSILSLRSPVAAWSLKLKVTESEGPGQCSLDSPGCPVMALWCRKLEDRLASIKAAGVEECSEAFLVNVNEKELKVALFRSPGGAIFELMEFKPS